MFTAGFMNASLHCETADKNSNGVFKKRAPNAGDPKRQRTFGFGK